MHLEFSGEPEINAPVERVWTHLLDHEFVAHCAPGVKRVEPLSTSSFRVVTGFAVGSLKLLFTVDVELHDILPGKSLSLTVHGKAAGSEVRARSAVALAPLPRNHTRLTWTAETTLMGTVVNVGSRLLRGSVRRITQKFWKKFAAAVVRDAGKARTK